MKFNHKSLGGFDVVTVTYINGIPGERKRVETISRVMVTVDAGALAQLLGPKAVANKKRRTRLAGGAIELVNLGSRPR